MSGEELPGVLPLVLYVADHLPRRERWAFLREVRRVRQRRLPDPLHLELTAVRDAYLNLYRLSQRSGRDSAAAAVGGAVGHSDPTAREVVGGAQLALVDAELRDLVRAWAVHVIPGVLEPVPPGLVLPAHDTYALETGAEIRAAYPGRNGACR